MRSFVFSGVGAVALLATSPAVAATTINFVPVGSDLVGAFGNLDPSGAAVDEYVFTLPTAGNVSGFVGSIGLRLTLTNLDFTSVTLNGQAFTIQNSGATEYRTIDLPVSFGPQLLSVGYQNAQRFSSYGGILSFTPAISAVPEPMTWAMMIVGFGIAGVAMRYRRRCTTIAYG